MKIFITGSTTGLGLIAGDLLLKEGHEVLFHARSKDSNRKSNHTYVYGDLRYLDEVKSLADQVNSTGVIDAIIHNAGVYDTKTEDLFNVNVVAPYVLGCLIKNVKRQVFLSSGMHLNGKLNFNSQQCTYSDTKLFDLMLAKYFSRKLPGQLSNAVDPGWVPTRMGGLNAPDDLLKGAETQAWLSVSSDPEALVTGLYFHHKKSRESNPLAQSHEAQDRLVVYLQEISNVKIPC